MATATASVDVTPVADPTAAPACLQDAAEVLPDQDQLTKAESPVPVESGSSPDPEPAPLDPELSKESGNSGMEQQGKSDGAERAGADNSGKSSPLLSEGSVEEVNTLLAEASITAATTTTNPSATPATAGATTTLTTTKQSKEGSSKQKRKEDKGIEHVLKALNSLETTEEKLAALCTKYTELLEEHRLMQNKFKQNQKKVTSLTREKDHLQNEQSKTVLAKSKLESLCRELQRHNKLIKDESVARAKEEEEKRKDVTAKFQTTINDIQRQMNENYEKNNLLREENVELAMKLKNLIEQYEMREKHIEKVFRHKELENQLVDAKLAQSNLQMTEEKERNLREKQTMVEEMGHSQAKIEILQAQEVQLRQQVALYTEKYEEFQATLAKSNDVFQSFKTEMDKMTKKIKKLEKETSMWRSRWENSNKALIEMAEEKTRSDKEILQLNSKVQKLESLCRALQEERKKLSSKVGGETGGPPQIVVDSDEATSKSSEVSKTIEVTKTPPNTPEGGRSSPEPGQEGNASPSSSQTSHTDISNGQSDDKVEASTEQSGAVLQAECVSDQLKAVLQQQGDGSTGDPSMEDNSGNGETQNQENEANSADKAADK